MKKQRDEEMSEPLKVPKTMQPIFAEVSRRIDEFCHEHLNEEYCLVSRELAATLCRADCTTTRWSGWFWLMVLWSISARRRWSFRKKPSGWV